MSPHRPVRRLIPALVAIALLAAACGSGSDDDAVSVNPIEPILANEIQITADPTGTTARLEVDTTIPVACNVIFGTDDNFGSIAVDSDMQGGAHDDHGPLMTGLEPDTEYQYILQGSDESGRIYRSDIMTFRTPSAADNGLGENLAPTGTITGSSSDFSSGFAAANAIDGDIGTEWSSAGDGDDAWIEIDLGESRDVAAVSFRTRSMTDGTAITETFTVTVDGTELGPFTAGNDPVVLDETVTGQVFRFDADSTTGGNTGATEIEIFGPS
jgi:F5/8 type C domain